MSDRYLDSLTPDFGEYSLDSILESCRRTAEGQAPAAPPRAEDIAERSRRLAMEALGQTLRQYQRDTAAAGPDSLPREQTAPAAVDVAGTEGEKDAGTPEPAPVQAEAPSRPRPTVTVGEDGIITLRYDAPEDEPEEAEPEEAPAPEEAADAAGEEPQAEEDGPEREKPRHTRRQPEARDAGGFGERFLTPIVRLIATSLAKKQMQKAEAANWPDPVEIVETPELPPRKAAKFYAAQIKPLRFRCRIATFLCVILAWISFQWPMAGMLGRSLPLQAGVSLVLALAVMVTALDVVAAGLRQVFDLRPGAEALAALSALLSCVDAAMVLFGYGDALPFCAIGSVSLAAALWGQRLTCSARLRTFKTAASSKNPSTLASEKGEGREPDSLLRAGGDGGIVRRAEQPDLCQTTYASAAPILLCAALALAIIASLGGQGGYFLHTLSALLSVSASFAAFFSFPLPYAIASRRLRSSGVAIAGYAGCADIGRTKRIVITDEDLFPPGTMKFSEINVQEGVFVNKVVSYTASLLAGSGSGVNGIFNELMTRRGYERAPVEQFKCHEGGGLSGIVGGERVLVGSAGFMNLMGIRLPQNLNPKNAICTAISEELVGVFTVEYIPVTSVQDALVTLLRGRTQAVFALRDFNITPLMIRQLFRMPTDNFNFPPFRDRYRLAGAAARRDAPPAAVITRNGMLPLVDAAESGRKLYTTCRINTILSLVGTALGMFIMFLLCRVGAFDTATAGNVLTFMLLWALPEVILSIGQNK